MASDDVRIRPAGAGVNTLGADDWEAFEKLLLDPPPPNEALLRAARRYNARRQDDRSADVRQEA